MADDSLSNQIYNSRDNIRLQLTENLKSYLELENVDLVKGSFVSYIINNLSTLTSNLLFYSSSVYREFFLTTAQLPESVLNLSTFLGYSAQKAVYAEVNVLVSIPMTFEAYPVRFTIPNGLDNPSFSFKADDVEFLTYYKTDVYIEDGSTVSVIVTKDLTKEIVLPYDITDNVLSFVLPLRQYKISNQEFQIDSDLQSFQFFTIDVPVTSSAASIGVTINGSEYTEYPTLYLMSYDTKGFVSRITSTGVRLYFGNGLIGYQPPKGGVIQVTIEETEGSEGNVLPGTITTKPRVYTNDGKALNYTITNPSAAFGGEDEESLEDIRRNAIASISSMHRLVTSSDYEYMGLVVDGSPITQRCLPILKRSDIVRNEIGIFINFSFSTTNIVPTRNAKYTVSPSTTYIPRGTTITIDEIDYITLYDVQINSLQKSAGYRYVITSVSLFPFLDTTYSAITTYPLTADKVYVSKDVYNMAEIKIHYDPLNFDPDVLECELYVEKSNQLYQMLNDSTSQEFSYVFNPYTKFPDGEVKVQFRFKVGTTRICDYRTTFVMYKSMAETMLSNISINTSPPGTTVYDIPVLLKSYYESIDQKSFESDIMQYMLTSMTMVDYRMLTDFANLKFSNTYGKMMGMQYNEPKEFIESIGVPHIPIPNRTYIVSGEESVDWKAYKNKYAFFTDSTNLDEQWILSDPIMDDVVQVMNEDKRYVYTGSEWFFPYYDIPLKIEVEVFRKTSYAKSDQELVSDVKNSLMDAFSERFGSNITLYRSEIIDVVQTVEGVRNCNLVNPKSNIFFNFKLMSLTKQQLLEYGPDHIYFNLSDITVRII